MPMEYFSLFVIRRKSKVLRLLLLFFSFIIGSSFCLWSNHVAMFKHLPCTINTHLPSATRPSNLVEEFQTKQFLFVGVMTTEKYMNTRARGVWDTWGRNVPGRLVFFTGQTNQTDWKDIPVIQLDVEDNVYPPQRKSLTMLKYIYEHFLDEYEWFIRADDDVYIRTGRLPRYLKRFDSSEDLVIGQPGIGKKEELGLLGLGDNDNFCIGGAGIMMTSGVLRKMGPHLIHCINTTASFHEDVEVGRCIRRFGGVMCPWAYEGKEIFQQSFGDPLHAYGGSLDTGEFDKGISFHPVKDPANMRRIHVHFATSAIKEQLRKKEKLSRLLEDTGRLLEGKLSYSQKRFPTAHNNPDCYTKNNSQPWEMFDLTKVWPLNHHPPLLYFSEGTEAGLTKMVHFAKEVVRGDGESKAYLAVNFDKWHTGYMRTSPKIGVEYIVTLGIKYNTLNDAGKFKTTKKRRLVHLRHTFAKLEKTSKETYGGEINGGETNGGETNGGETNGGETNGGETNGGETNGGKTNGGETNGGETNGGETNGGETNGGETNGGETNGGDTNGGETNGGETSGGETSGVSTETVHFILALMERLDNFKRFLASFAKEFLATNDPVKLLIIYFTHGSSTVKHKEAFQSYVKKYPSVEMTWLDLNHPFKKALALQLGTNYYANDSLLFFCDVDYVFRREFANRCRANTVLGKRVYFPVVFSQFNPRIAYAVKKHPGTHHYYRKERGFWRYHGMGPVCAYAKDINDSGGLNTDLEGWGMEDVDLYEKFVKRDDIEMFRAPDPGLVHVYHPHIACAPGKITEQVKTMCMASKADIFSSAASSVDYLNFKGHLDNI